VDIDTGDVVEFTGDDELHEMLKRICRENDFSESYHVLEVFGNFNGRSSKKIGTMRQSAQSR
jgi:Fe2+ or Zn2+ uptake regulation protein